MFDPLSRYAKLDEKEAVMPDGRRVVYVARRFLPRLETLHRLGRVRVEEGDRLDRVTARALQDPERFWRIGDANPELDPEDLLEPVGRALTVPTPEA